MLPCWIVGLECLSHENLQMRCRTVAIATLAGQALCAGHRAQSDRDLLVSLSALDSLLNEKSLYINSLGSFIVRYVWLYRPSSVAIASANWGNPVR
jgi:hypothetical protein